MAWSNYRWENLRRAHQGRFSNSNESNVRALDFFANKKPPKQNLGGNGSVYLRRSISGALSVYSESQVTVKLVPSELRPDGTASSAPVLPLIMIDSKTLLPNAPIAPDTEESVASLVLLTPV